MPPLLESIALSSTIKRNYTIFWVCGQDCHASGRSQVNLLRTEKREHSRKPDEFVILIEECSSAPRLEMFARGDRDGWDMWGNQAVDNIRANMVNLCQSYRIAESNHKEQVEGAISNLIESTETAQTFRDP